MCITIKNGIIALLTNTRTQILYGFMKTWVYTYAEEA